MTRIPVLGPLLACLLSLPLLAAPPLEQIMANPDWIGPPVQESWLSLDGRQAYYRIKQDGSSLRELRRIDLASSSDQPVADSELADIDGSQPIYDRGRQRALFVRNGDLFLRDLRNGQLRQLSRGVDGISSPRFGTDGRVIVRAGARWLRIDPTSSLATPLADLRFEDAPDGGEKQKDELRQTQLRLFETLQRERREREEGRDEDRRLRSADDSRAPAPWYLGKERRVAASEASPDGRWLLLATQPADPDAGETGKMPLFVTESGYTEIEDVRIRVGRKTPVGQQFELLDLVRRERHPLVLDGALPGLKDDPLAALREREGAPKAPELRAVHLLGAEWSADARHLALQLRSVDNKDRWLVTIEPGREPAALTLQHRLTDPAWINWNFNEFGWLPDNRSLWYLSEETGHAHLYLKPVGGRARALTSGRWEVHEPSLSAGGDGFWLLGNHSHPTEFDLYRVGLDGAAPRRLTQLLAVERYVVASDQSRVLIAHSRPYTPTQLAVLDVSDGRVRELTDTRTAEYRAVEWPGFEIVGVPSSHQEQPIWSKLYRPQQLEPGKRYPAVLFVHGAGYLQNTHHRFGHYYREQMFHHLLVERGFIVLDMDFRASAGYGRDWRTAIYRQMGHPELEDLIDGVDWLVENHQVDGDRIGVYGGSYGGFMALMALFREPDRFVAGAALRPVTDWRHYNHPYTSNILNTPDLDPEAHRISSPIEYAEHLRGHLLIAHGMLDDNVFYQDAVMLAQRLIELKKENWELASYPLERHSYVHPESWLDQYRRVLRLFENTLLR